MLKARESLTTLNTAQVLTQSITFWLAHVAIGSVSLQAGLAHVCMLVRFCDERGASWTRRQYCKHQTLSIHAKIREGEPFDMGLTISREDLDITRLVSLEIGKAPGNKNQPASHVSTAAAIAATPAVAAVASSAAARPPKAAKDAGKGKPQKLGYICFAGDPANGLSCSDKTCQKLHLDTRIPDQAERFSKAKAGFDRKRSDSSKAGGKGN